MMCEADLRQAARQLEWAASSRSYREPTCAGLAELQARALYHRALRREERPVFVSAGCQAMRIPPPTSGCDSQRGTEESYRTQRLQEFGEHSPWSRGLAEALRPVAQRSRQAATRHHCGDHVHSDC